jgi:transposase-like protein
MFDCAERRRRAIRVALLRSQGHSVIAIARRWRCSTGSIRNWIRDASRRKPVPACLAPLPAPNRPELVADGVA